MKFTRTYPLPNSTEPHIGPRFRAMAIFKYLLDLEPEAAIKDERFAIVEEGFRIAEARGRAECIVPVEYDGRDE